jgi:hypothetical protein
VLDDEAAALLWYVDDIGAGDLRFGAAREVLAREEVYAAYVNEDLL